MLTRWLWKPWWKEASGLLDVVGYARCCFSLSCLKCQYCPRWESWWIEEAVTTVLVWSARMWDVSGGSSRVASCMSPLSSATERFLSSARPPSLPPSLPGSLSLLLEPDSQPLLSIKAQLKHDFPPLSSLPWFLQLDMLTPSWAFFLSLVSSLVLIILSVSFSSVFCKVQETWDRYLHGPCTGV